MKTEAKRRRDRRIYMRKYREEKATANVQRHPTLSNEEIAAVEEVIATEEAAEYGRPRDAHIFAPEQTAETEKKPVPDCLAALAEFEQRLEPHLKELGVLKHGPVQPEQKIKIPPPFDLPNGVIL